MKLENLVLVSGSIIVITISLLIYFFPVQHWDLTAYMFLAIITNAVITLSLVIKKENQYLEE